MWEFFVFWFTAIWQAIKSAWGLAGFLDLMITMVGVALYDRLKDRGPHWLRRLIAEKLPSKGGFILAMFLVWFVPATFLFAPYWQFKDERAKRITAENKAKPTEVEAGEEWPALNADQIAKLATEIAPYHITKISVAWGRRVRAEKLFQSLQAVGKRLPGCKVHYAEGSYTDGDRVEILTLKSNPAGEVFLRMFRDELHWPVALDHYSYESAETHEKGTVSIAIPDKR